MSVDMTATAQRLLRRTADATRIDLLTRSAGPFFSGGASFALEGYRAALQHQIGGLM